MRRSAGSLMLITLTLIGICSTATLTQTLAGGIQGAVTDDSGGVLPGVTVVATSRDGRVIETAVTDAGGGYAFSCAAGGARLTFPAGRVLLDAVVEVAVQSGGELPGRRAFEGGPRFRDGGRDRKRIARSFVRAVQILAPALPELIPMRSTTRNRSAAPRNRAPSRTSLGTIRSGNGEAERRLYEG